MDWVGHKGRDEPLGLTAASQDVLVQETGRCEPFSEWGGLVSAETGPTAEHLLAVLSAG